jgi:hypothetical protein
MGKSSSSSEEEKKEKKEKKVKTKKPKQVILSNKSFSQRYSSFFNNKNLSDFTITIGDETIFSHKFVLSNNSTFFENLINESSTFTFPKEDDSTAAKSLVKFFYEGLYEYTDESQVVVFTLLANKVNFTLYNKSIKLKILQNSNYLRKFY